MTELRPLVLDLDFTLLHLRPEADAIEVPGRTRSAWISPRTVATLSALQSSFAIVLATARSWDGARWVSEGLAARGVAVAGIVLEDGALLGQLDGFAPLEVGRDWEALRAHVEAKRAPHWPVFSWQRDFKACLVARAESPAAAQELAPQLYAAMQDFDATLRGFRDGRKIYLAGGVADKWTALQTLLGARAQSAAGVGDGLNDAVWLREIASPCTMTGAAPEIIELVRAKGGYISPHRSHEGICDVLERLATK